MDYIWGLWVDTDDDGVNRLSVSSFGKRIAIVRDIESAALIAAAPQLASALKEILPLIREQGDVMALSGDYSLQDAIQEADEAIKAAEQGRKDWK